MGEFLAKLLDFVTNISLRKLLGLLVLIAILAIGFPYVDNVFFKLGRIEKQIKLLTDLSAIDQTALETKGLNEIYFAIKDELAKSVGIAQARSPAVRYYTFWSLETLFKFISSASLCILVLIAFPFLKTEKGQHVPVLIAIFLLIAITGAIGAIVPTFGNPMVNYIGMPLLEILIITVVAVVLSTRKKKGTTTPG